MKPKKIFELKSEKKKIYIYNIAKPKCPINPWKKAQDQSLLLDCVIYAS